MRCSRRNARKFLIGEKDGFDLVFACAGSEHWQSNSLAVLMNSSVKPDFSGEWVLNRQMSHLTGGASEMKTGVLRIEHRDPNCGFQISMSTCGESVEHERESSLSDEIPVVGKGFYVVVFWEGDALVFECGSKGP